MESIFCFVRFFLLFSKEINISVYFSNHFQGQDILHVDVYDDDIIKNDIIGSLKIDLQDLYQKRIYYSMKLFFSSKIFFLRTY
jgi:Ca2+-dependent lipid-binding protein